MRFIGYSEIIRSRVNLLGLHAVCITLLLPVFTPMATAQDGDDVWRDLMMQAQLAAGSGHFAEAEQAYLKAAHEAERFGADDWRVGVTLEGLGQTYGNEKKYADAENALRRSLEITAKTNGDDSVDAANVNFDIGNVFLASSRPVQAVLYARKALSSWVAKLGGTSMEAANGYCLVGDALRAMRNFIDAEEPLRQCADIRESSDGIDSVDLAKALHSLALTYEGEKKYALADTRFDLAEKIRESKLGLTSPLLAETLEDHAALLKAMGRNKDAERLLALAGAIRHTEKTNTR